MSFREALIAYQTIVRQETMRFLKIWTQTLLPPVMTTTLYFVIFGTFIGSQIAPIGGYTYMQFIVPGLVMMTVITSSFMNVVSSFYSAKFMHQIEEIMVSPAPAWVVIGGFVTGGVLRGVLTGTIVYLTSLFFTDIVIHNIPIILLFTILTAILFSLGGLVNGIYARSFDAMAIIPTFVLTPLTYLGGVFYSITLLSPFWQSVSKLNPVFYMINGFRYGFLGISDISLLSSFAILIVLTAAMLLFSIHLFRTGRGLRA
jgi:ABC-2 type transport system permease protein